VFELYRDEEQGAAAGEAAFFVKLFFDSGASRVACRAVPRRVK
jgi:hypothetical protein